jgi:hypothetical protein
MPIEVGALHGAAGPVFPGDAQDLVGMVGNLRDDMLGNLRDNACRWACSLGRGGGSPMAPAPAARGEDDGPGIA